MTTPVAATKSKRWTTCQRASRTLINGILWILRTGAPWRDLPDRYGAWETVSGRFYAWRKRGL
ncbi:MAG: transposase [Myxacorys californica WJT36-NPBG1]|nr:transposase [Myxacorys californica WJT36-NPBG1]